MHEFINSENFTISHAEVYFNKKNHFERENYRNREFFFLLLYALLGKFFEMKIQRMIRIEINFVEK